MKSINTEVVNFITYPLLVYLDLHSEYTRIKKFSTADPQNPRLAEAGFFFYNNEVDGIAVKTKKAGLGSQNSSEALLSWSAAEYEHSQKSKEWYWTVGIMASALMVVALLLKNILFAILLALAGFVIMLYGTRRPSEVGFALKGSGLLVGQRLYPYESFESFWIHYDPPNKKELDLVSKRFFMPRMTIPLRDVDPNEVRKILIKVLQEKEAPESLSETIAKRLGF